VTRLLLIASLLLAHPLYAQRMSSDFEIARMREQIAKSPDFVAQLSGRLNLGDLYLSRSDRSTAAAEYNRARELAQSERIRARLDSDMTGYATATAYAALAEAKLRRGPESFTLLEEAVRFASDSAKTWNIYASAMTLLGRAEKGVGAARNAVSIATVEAQQKQTVSARLDLATYSHGLASALIDAGKEREAEAILRDIVASLERSEFDAIRRDVERAETFEIYSTARGDTASYLSLFNRAQLRLAALQEKRGELAAARATYERVLGQRSDDPTALAALARLSPAAERARWFAAAFDANPFSLPLVRAYQEHIAAHGSTPIESGGPGAEVRRVLHHIAAGETRAARSTLDDLLARFPSNQTLRHLRTEMNAPVRPPDFLATASSESIEASGKLLREIIRSNERLTPEQREKLDQTLFRGLASFTTATEGTPGQTTLESGTIDGVDFRFMEPTAFHGIFSTGTPIRLTFRILGVTEVDGRDAILLEPLGIEAAD
jgi:tetratricopeptide (TPR) repeat protein